MLGTVEPDATPTLEVAINARFAGRPVTGVERYATELTARIAQDLGEDVTRLAPRVPLGGVRGHVWEQVALPAAFSRSSAKVLLSLCNVGPVAVTSQLVVIHDVAPFLHPRAFTPRYRAQVTTIQRLLSRRCALATVSQRSRLDIADVFGVDPATVAVVPPAVGAPFSFSEAGTGGRRCVFVGAHDQRKNLELLLRIWPEVHRRTGLELVVVGRRSSSTVRSGVAGAVPGVARFVAPTDQQLATLYRSALCVLSPSRYEGFGLPLLEGMGCGTPFLSTDTGAAAELAVAPDQQVLPPDPSAWIERLVGWANDDLATLRAASLERARLWSWRRSAAALLTAAEAAVGR